MTKTQQRSLRTEVLLSSAVILGLILAAELVFRAMVPGLSANSRTLAAAPERSARLIEAATEGRPTVLVLGNSISGEGIDGEQLADLIADAGLTVQLEHQPADTTVMRDWFYEFKNLFVAPGAAPDWLVLPVGDAAPLRRVNERTEDLMFSFVTWSDMPGFVERNDIRGLEEVCGTVFGKLSALYGFRGRFQKRVLVTLASRYEELRYQMRESGAATSGEDQISEDAQWARALAALAQEHGTEVLIVAMPTDAIESTIPETDRALARELGWGVIAPGLGHEWTRADRPDGLHLEAPARARFTALLATELVRVLRSGEAPEGDRLLAPQ